MAQKTSWNGWRSGCQLFLAYNSIAPLCRLSIESQPSPQNCFTRRNGRSCGREIGILTPGHKESPLNQDGFDNLLSWLDSDRDRAGEKYEVIRRGLIKMFVRRRCPTATAEKLADETFDRVCQKLDEITDGYIGDPALFVYGVAKYIYLEEVKRKPTPPWPPPEDPPNEEEDLRYQCLDQCMEKLDGSDRKLIINFYQHDKRAKIAHREELARKHKITVHALRMRAHRIRNLLKECIKECLDRS